ncbi:hypothetical protein [Plasticicumulans acidivorans]|uniref:PsiF repeat-containing protein n=1 Tax=Plasticicumulans acidivorans TaxID=886464 RepID=A0A317MS68_9GAMM|nr:hypothetical protein [Plasticicumulans acidivorans]PWV59284.1 hypothetical protein C7443_11152 [Plasticicumulans acidivorans]
MKYALLTALLSLPAVAFAQTPPKSFAPSLTAPPGDAALREQERAGTLKPAEPSLTPSNQREARCQQARDRLEKADAELADADGAQVGRQRAMKKNRDQARAAVEQYCR